MTYKKKKSPLISRAVKLHPGLALSVLGLAIVVGGIYVGADATNHTTTTTCKPVSASNAAAASPSSSQVAYSLSSQGQGKTAQATVKAGSACVGFPVSLVSYNSPSSSGSPLNKQTIFDSQTKITTSEPISFSIEVPNCFYQIDLVYGNPIDLRTGATYHGTNTYLTGVKGGSGTCVQIGGTPTPTTNPTNTPGTTGTPEPTPTPTPAHTPTPTPEPSDSPSPTDTPIDGTTGDDGGGDEGVTTAPGETVEPEASGDSVLADVLPETGKAGQFMTIVGALLITAGLVHLWLTQRRKLLLGGGKRS